MEYIYAHNIGMAIKLHNKGSNVCIIMYKVINMKAFKKIIILWIIT